MCRACSRILDDASTLLCAMEVKRVSARSGSLNLGGCRGVHLLVPKFRAQRSPSSLSVPSECQLHYRFGGGEGPKSVHLFLAFSWFVIGYLDEANCSN